MEEGKTTRESDSNIAKKTVRRASGHGAVPPIPSLNLLGFSRETLASLRRVMVRFASQEIIPHPPSSTRLIRLRDGMGGTASEPEVERDFLAGEIDQRVFVQYWSRI